MDQDREFYEPEEIPEALEREPDRHWSDNPRYWAEDERYELS